MNAARMLVAAAVAGAAAVVLGAFAAHGLKEKLSAEAMAWWDTAVKWQVCHALALGLCAVLARTGKPPRGSAVCFVVGIVLFCGSLYAMALGGWRWLGMVTPVGGVAFVLGWVLLARCGAGGSGGGSAAVAERK